VNRILVALDVDSGGKAIALADTLRASVAGFKIGKQLFTAEGPAMVRTLADRGDRVFLDLKFHDIPNTVAGAVASAVATGAWMVNVHASGGRRMMEAAAQAATAAADRLGRPRPLVIAVTVLTSLDQAGLHEVGVKRPMLDHVVSLARLAQDSGLDGVVASPQEIAAIRAACGCDFQIVTPGIRPVDTPKVSNMTSSAAAAGDDQARTMGPAEAVERGASYLVIGRPITAAPDPAAAAERMAAETAAVISPLPAP
jgi:orotidine-5'-phosphate decarboxylase